jgi:general stress protein 26
LGTADGRNYIITRLVADIAEDYYELLALDKQLDTLNKTIELQEQSLVFANAKKEAGRGTELAVQRFQAEVRKNQSEKLVISQNIVEAENRSGYRTNVMYRYTLDEAGEPVFGPAVRSTGTLRELTGRRQGAEPPSEGPRPRRDTVITPSLEEVARRVVRAVAYPTFITTDATGRPQARTVQPQQPDGNWTVWFATNPRTRKVTEIQRDPRVVLHYFDPVTLSYVSLIGRARVVRDRASKAAHWDRSWDAFYPDREASVVLRSHARHLWSHRRPAGRTGHDPGDPALPGRAHP